MRAQSTHASSHTHKHIRHTHTCALRAPSNASFWGCSHLTGAGLEGVATTTLTSLNLASLDRLTDEAFTSIISRTPNLSYMNVNGCAASYGFVCRVWCVFCVCVCSLCVSVKRVSV